MYEQFELNLNTEQIGEYTLDDLCKILKTAKSNIILKVPRITSSSSYLDLAASYGWILFVGESIAEFCENIYANKHPSSVHFIFRPQNVVGLAEKLLWLFPKVPEHEDYENLELDEQYHDFIGSLEEKKLNFNELGDDFIANFVAGQDDYFDYEYDQEYFIELHSKYPERLHYFWRSFLSDCVGFDFYVSRYSWIVPYGLDVRNLLKQYGGFENGLPALENSEYLLGLNLPPLVFNKTSIVLYPQERIYEAQKCAEAIWLGNTNAYSRRHELIQKILQSGCNTQDIPNEFFQGINKVTHIHKILLSTEENVLIVQDSLAQYVFFANTIEFSGDRLKFWGNELEKINYQSVLGVMEEYLSVIAKKIKTLIGESTQIACPWEKLDDDQFEELCYDIICIRYQPKEIRKFGKSRSRDGGRDIEFQTYDRLGKNSVKWIVQCKLIRDKSSLTGKKVEVSDTVAQYGSGGFCVMTSGVIDSTLYDKLDGIARNTGIERDAWSKLELERFLARHPEVRDRYFGEKIADSKASQNQDVQLNLFD